MSETSFARRIYELRTNAKLTQIALANVAGITDKAIQNYESGKQAPSLTVLLPLADFFGVSIDYMVGRTDTKEINKSKDKTKIVTISLYANLAGQWTDITEEGRINGESVAYFVSHTSPADVATKDLFQVWVDNETYYLHSVDLQWVESRES